MELNEIQEKIRKFNDEREWSTLEHMKDLLLNMTEEVGEMWNLIKWIDAEKQQEMIRKNKEEVENFVGDILYLILKIAYLSDVDSEKGIMDVLEEYEKRFPIEKVKGSHANVRAGGFDDK
ncbi:hypothetical protein HYT25_01310 [Candidatus Pacearchaeota archaeon]|nr:hypothetical protein [Candidatus Pacearchaeota archaeon]